MTAHLSLASAGGDGRPRSRSRPRSRKPDAGASLRSSTTKETADRLIVDLSSIKSSLLKRQDDERRKLAAPHSPTGGATAITGVTKSTKSTAWSSLDDGSSYHKRRDAAATMVRRRDMSKLDDSGEGWGRLTNAEKRERHSRDNNGGSSRGRAPQAAAEKLADAWRDRARVSISRTPVPDDLTGLGRRRATRRRLASGPVQLLVAEQITVLDKAEEKLEKQSSAAEDRTLEAERGRARLDQAKELVKKTVDDMSSDIDVAPEVRGFLSTTYADFLTLLLLRNDLDTESEAWNTAYSVGEALVAAAVYSAKGQPLLSSVASF